jgi:hypothetical protein
MKFKKGDHLQEIGSISNGIVINVQLASTTSVVPYDNWWYLIENDELNLVNHWVPEIKLELHKQPLRESKLEQLGIK